MPSLYGAVFVNWHLSTYDCNQLPYLNFDRPHTVWSVKIEIRKLITAIRREIERERKLFIDF